MEKKKIAIVGAGISGLLACKYTLSKGFIPLVFEARDSIGGVWRKTIESTKLQSPKAVYQFSDFPWPPQVTTDFPTQKQVLEYIQAYAHHFDLFDHIRFNSKVVSLSYQEPSEAETGKWNLTVENTSRLKTEVHQVDFVILCSGRYSDVPNIPEFPENRGPDSFLGKVIHSMDYSNMDQASVLELIRGKKFVVVGSQKSGMDIARECSNANGVENPCTLLYRSEHWNIPDFMMGRVHFAFLYRNRFSELLIHKPTHGLLFKLLATILSPLRWGISKLVESDIKRKLRLARHGMVPRHSFLKELNSCTLAVVPEGFFDRVEEGSIKLKKAQNLAFCSEGLLFDGDQDEPLNADLVILATGFRDVDKLKDLFVSPSFQDCIAGKTRLPLYRKCIHPRIPQLAFIGYSESMINLFTSEMQCRWLAELLVGTFKLPSIEEMEKDISQWDEFSKQSLDLDVYYDRSCLGPLHIWYNDQLCNDMGWNPKRKKGFLRELFEPYGPLDYASKR